MTRFCPACEWSTPRGMQAPPRAQTPHCLTRRRRPATHWQLRNSWSSSWKRPSPLPTGDAAPQIRPRCLPAAQLLGPSQVYAATGGVTSRGRPLRGWATGRTIALPRGRVAGRGLLTMRRHWVTTRSLAHPKAKLRTTTTTAVHLAQLPATVEPRTWGDDGHDPASGSGHVVPGAGQTSLCIPRELTSA